MKELKELFEKQQEIANKVFELYSKGYQVWCRFSPHVNTIEVWFYTDTEYYNKHKELQKELCISCFPCYKDYSKTNITFECSPFADTFNIILKTFEDIEQGNIPVYTWNEIRPVLKMED